MKLLLVLNTCSFIYYFFMNGCKMEVSTFSITMSFLLSMIGAYNSIMSFVVMRLCSMSYFSMFNMLGGMFLPFIYGAIWLDEKVTVLKVVAIILLIFSLVLISIKSKGDYLSTKGLLICITVFISNGFISVLTKFHQINPKAIGTLDFSLWNITFTMLVLVGMNIYFSRKLKKEEKKEEDTTVDAPEKKKSTVFIRIILILIMVSVSCVQNLSMLFGAKDIPAGMLYPMTTGGSIVLMTVFGAVCYKEKITKRIAAGVVIALLATILFAF